MIKVSQGETTETLKIYTTPSIERKTHKISLTGRSGDDSDTIDLVLIVKEVPGQLKAEPSTISIEPGETATASMRPPCLICHSTVSLIPSGKWGEATSYLQ